MKGAKFLQRIGLIIAIPLMGYAVYVNGAEPLPTEGVMPTVVLTTETAEEEGGEEDMTVEYGELDLLAACVEAEAGNQSMLGRRLVVDVILNRVEAAGYPDTITEVINDPGQFAVVENGMIDSAVPSEKTWLAIYAEMNGIRIDKEILFFQTGGYGYGTPWEHVGDHYFSTGGIQ